MHTQREYIEWEWYPYIRNLTLPAFDHITLYISVFYFYIVQERERENTRYGKNSHLPGILIASCSKETHIHMTYMNITRV